MTVTLAGGKGTVYVFTVISSLIFILLLLIPVCSPSPFLFFSLMHG